MRAKQLRQGILIGFLLLVAGWLFSLVWSLAGKAQVAITEAHNAERQYKEIEDRRVALEANLSAISTSLGQDTAIRTAFGVARPGEEVIVVVPPEAPTTTPPLSWWQKLLSWF